MRGYLMIITSLFLLTVSSAAEQSQQQTIQSEMQIKRVKVKVPGFAVEKLNELGYFGQSLKGLQKVHSWLFAPLIA